MGIYQEQLNNLNQSQYDKYAVRLSINHHPRKRKTYKVPTLNVPRYKESKKMMEYTWRRELQREKWSERREKT